MNKEDKELLLQDLCARLPYGLYVQDEYGDIVYISYNDVHFANYFDSVLNGTIKPYLFPLSSMTDEQLQEYRYIVNYLSPDDTDSWQEGEFVYVGGQMTQLLYFYLSNHLDFRRLIERDLANDATGKNIY